MNALILGSVAHLREPTHGLGLGSEVCDEQPDGAPPPNAGQVYYAITEGEWTNNETETLDEYYAIEVTITVRTGYVPQDRFGVELKRKLRTMTAELRARIHDNPYLRLLANTFIEGEGVTVNGFCEPLRFLSAGKITPRGPDWFTATDTQSRSPPTGLSITLRFGKARRLQSNDGIDGLTL